ncbi:MAG: hypothetical protein QM642_11910, partial [Edaphocola sp.]
MYDFQHDLNPKKVKQRLPLIKIFANLIFALNIGATLWLLLCKYVSFHNIGGVPTKLSLLSFTCFFAVLANVLFAVYWLVFTKRKIRALWSLAALVICWDIAVSVFGLNYIGHNNVAPTDEGGLKIMQWNVHMFDLGEWTRDKSSKAKILK